MRVVYDDEKFLKDKKMAKLTHLFPTRIINLAITTIPTFLCSLLTLAVLYFNDKTGNESIKLNCFAICCMIGGLLVTAIMLALLILKPCSANTEFGLCKEKNELIGHHIKEIKGESFYVVFYKSKKGRNGHIEIPLNDVGCFKEIKENIIDLTATTKSGKADLYRCEEKRKLSICRDVEYSELPTELKNITSCNNTKNKIE